MTHESIVGLFFVINIMSEPYPTSAPEPIAAGTDQWNNIWNVAWNEGYTHSTDPMGSFSSSVSSNPGGVPGYSEGYQAGQQAFQSRNTNPQPTTNNVQTTSVPTNPVNNPQQPTGPTYEDLVKQEQDRIRADISGGYDSYLASLDDMINNDIPNQGNIQNQILQNNLQGNIGNLDSQKAEGEFDLANEATKVKGDTVKTLKDVSENIRNLMQAGNNYLGSRGAGDSSSVGQYSYALTKLGSKQRGDIMSQERSILGEISNKKWKLTNAYNSEVNKLRNEVTSKALEVQSWMGEQQANLRLMAARGELDKTTSLANLSKSILDESLRRLTSIQAEAANKQTALQNWALNNATTIAEATAAINYKAPGINYQQMTPSFSSGGGTNSLIYGGYSGNDTEDNIF